MDVIFLRDLRVETIIGIWDWERELPQKVRIDLDLAADVARAAATDSIDDALNYKAVADGVSALVREARYRLVETLAERIAAYVRDEHGVPWVAVTVSKPGAIRGSRDVGVRIERGERKG